jgi:uncharacterized membrane protein
MKIYALSYLATAIVFVGIDAIWLSTMGNALYRPLLGEILLEKFNPAPAALFYLLYFGGIVYFAVAPAIESGRWTTALCNGALFGFFAYATYDLTNQATLKVWSTVITVADLCWGTALTAVAATLGYLIARAIAGAVSA